jgi:hypothetical protein
MNNDPPSPRVAIFCGLIAAAIGLFYVLLSVGVIPTGMPHSDQDPTWIGTAFGLIFLFGGGAVIIQTIFSNGRTSDEGLPTTAPVWLRWFYQLLCAGIVALLGAVFTWIAIGPGKRSFTGNGAIFGETAGRVAFGIGAALIWIVLAAIAIVKVRRLVQRR